MEIVVNGGTITEEEKNNYIKHVSAKEPGKELVYLEINLDGDYVDLKYKFADVPFERIRRVTGYLTGTLDRWNDAKRAEEADRVKHGICDCCH
ncbi:MAG: anaerobic ribonucleoside-triphosphate reductase [Oscillospiraceae bacterium]